MLIALIIVQNIVADMRKVLSKNPQVEQQRLHRRVFLDNVTPENQALLVSIHIFTFLFCKSTLFSCELCIDSVFQVNFSFMWEGALQYIISVLDHFEL